MLNEVHTYIRRYDDVKRKALADDQEAREEVYSVRGHIVQYAATGTVVQEYPAMRTSVAKIRLQSSMEMLREQHLRVVVGGKYMITKSADVMNRNVANERFTIYNCDIVTAVGFVTDGSVSFPGHIDIMAHEQYRVKCSDLLQILRKMRWGGHGEWSAEATLLLSRQLGKPNVVLGPNAFAALPVHQQVDAMIL